MEEQEISELEKSIDFPGAARIFTKYPFSMSIAEVGEMTPSQAVMLVSTTGNEDGWNVVEHKTLAEARSYKALIGRK